MHPAAPALYDLPRIHPSHIGRLLVLDARTLDITASATLPQIVPFYFHGQWL